MKNRKQNRRSRLDRIESKCDRILSELITIRRRLDSSPDMDTAIDRLHRAALKLRSQCEHERDYIRRMFNS